MEIFYILMEILYNSSKISLINKEMKYIFIYFIVFALFFHYEMWEEKYYNLQTQLFKVKSNKYIALYEFHKLLRTCMESIYD